MKKIYLTSALAIALFVSNKALAQQGFGTNTPDKSSAVDIVSTKRGLLIPRIALTSADLAAPVNAPATSLLVYNTATAGAGNDAVTPGFYYWNGIRWDRFVSGNDDKSVTVSTADPKVTVTPTTTGNVTDFSLQVNTSEIDINSLKNTLNPDKITPGTDKQVLVTKMVAGELKSTFVDASDVIADGILAENGLTKTGNKITLGGTLNAPATLITTAQNPFAIQGLDNVSTGFEATAQNVVIMGADGILKQVNAKSMVEDVVKDGLSVNKIAAAGGIITINGGTELADAVMKDITLDVANTSIIDTKLSSKKPDNSNYTAGDVATADGNGGVTYQNAAASLGKTLTTDGVIVVGADNTSTTALAANTVLTDLKLNIGQNKITADHIATGAVTADELADGSISAADLKSEGNAKVLTTDATGVVTWADQSALNNKDAYTGTAPIVVSAGVANATGGKDYTISASIANTDLGVVKQAATNPQVTIATDGTLGVNTSNITLGGDVTGTVQANTVTKIQGVNVDATTPTANQVLSYDGTQWKPTTPNNLVEVENGITKDGTTQKIQLGGALTKATEITTSGTNTLAVKGLEAPSAAGKVLFTENTTGVMRSVERALSYTANASFTIDNATITGYNEYVQVINVTATIPATGDLDINLPAATTGNNGQVIHVKVANTTEAHSGYLNILSGATTLAYGALPYQAWVLRSDGTAWQVVSRN